MQFRFQPGPGWFPEAHGLNEDDDLLGAALGVQDNLGLGFQDLGQVFNGGGQTPAGAGRGRSSATNPGRRPPR